MVAFNDILINIIQGAIPLAIIFLFGCVGEILTEKSGNLNLGLPGVMCFGAVGGVLGCVLYMKTIYQLWPIDVSEPVITFVTVLSYICLLLFAIVFACIFGAISGLIFSFLTTTLKANQNITGLALTTFGGGFADFVVPLITPKEEEKALLAKAAKILKFSLPYDRTAVGIWGDSFLNQSILVVIGFAIAIVAFVIINKTRVGLSLRSVGENPATADAAGINTNAYRYGATLIGCAIAGLGGLFYVVKINGWENSATLQGFGWMVLALVIFAVWNPLIAIVGSLVFGALWVSPQSGISTNTAAGKDLLKITPYVVTVVVLVITSIVGKKSVLPPGSLGINYFREER